MRPHTCVMLVIKAQGSVQGWVHSGNLINVGCMNDQIDEKRELEAMSSLDAVKILEMVTKKRIREKTQALSLNSKGLSWSNRNRWHGKH